MLGKCWDPPPPPQAWSHQLFASQHYWRIPGSLSKHPCKSCIRPSQGGVETGTLASSELSDTPLPPAQCGRRLGQAHTDHWRPRLATPQSPPLHPSHPFLPFSLALYLLPRPRILQSKTNKPKQNKKQPSFPKDESKTLKCWHFMEPDDKTEP